MIQLRKANDRGHFDFGWLKTFHTFSFSDYQDPKFMGFRSLRVINEDWVQPAEGFDTHPHRDMEIITYVIEGQLEHKDSMGNGSIISPGEVQYMSAGTGVTHSEFNHSKTDSVHLLQIWIYPDKKGYKPAYDQKTFKKPNTPELLKMVSGQSGGNWIQIRQDVVLSVGILSAGEKMATELGDGRYGWVQVVKGKIGLNNQTLEAGDGAAISDEKAIQIKAEKDSEFLFFDLN